MNFNLVSEPWISVYREKGPPVRVSLLDILLNAHEWKGLDYSVPLYGAAIVRFMVAVILDIVRPRTQKDIVGLLQQGQFDSDLIERYFVKHGAAFDLFSPTHPFLQQADAEGPDKPLTALFPAVPSGTNVVHWHHGGEEDFAVAPSEAAVLMLMLAPFMTAGGAGLSPSINGAPPFYAMIEGRTLHETIVLNCIYASEEKLGVPAWRRTTRLEIERRRQSATILEGLTWSPRTVRLIPSGPGRCSISGVESPVLVRGMKFSRGESCDFEWRDPNVAYIITDEKRSPTRPRENRDAWRDVTALALLPDQRSVEHGARVRIPPLVVDQFLELYGRNDVDVGTELRLTLYGMRTDMKMKIFEWLGQPLHIPTTVAAPGARQKRVINALENAESAQRTLKRAMVTAATLLGGASGSKPHIVRAREEALTRSATRQFWSTLEEPFMDLVHAIGNLDPEEDAEEIDRKLREWKRLLRTRSLEAYDEATDTLRRDARSLQAIERGRQTVRTMWHSKRRKKINHN